MRKSSIRKLPNVIIPPRLGKKDHEFFLPTVFIWCPMQHFRLEIPCPIHHSPLTASFFTDELQKVSPRNPRLVYDLRGNILLVQRLYTCNQGQQARRYLSASMPVLKQIPKVYLMCCFPIVMFHRSACTNDLVDFVETEILQGVSFFKDLRGYRCVKFQRVQRAFQMSFTLSRSSTT